MFFQWISMFVSFLKCPYSIYSRKTSGIFDLHVSQVECLLHSPGVQRWGSRRKTCSDGLTRRLVVSDSSNG